MRDLMPHMKETETSRRFHLALVALLTIIGVIILLTALCGCIPEHQKLGNECNRIGWGMVVDDLDVPQDKRELADAALEMNTALVEQHGKPNDVVTPKNVKDKMGDTAEAARNYQNPLGGWLASLFGIGTGNSLWDSILTLLLGYLGIKKLGNRVRKTLHKASHVPAKEEVDGKAAQS